MGYRVYCNKCKERTSVNNAVKEAVSRTTGNRFAVRGNCDACGSKVYSFVKGEGRIPSRKQILNLFSFLNRRGT